MTSLSHCGAPHGTPPYVVQRPVPDPQAPDVNGGRVSLPEAVRRGDHVLADGPLAAVHIDGDDLAVVGGLDLSPDVPLVDLVAEAGRLLG